MSEDYWIDRYNKKLGSGKGSIGKVGKYKHKILRNYLKNYEDFSFLDFGNGDLSFWKGKPPKHYTGIDIAENIQEINRKKYEKLFLTANLKEHQNIKADVVICFDVLFHIIDDIEYNDILLNLCLSSRKYIFVYTWMKRPKNYEESYQKYREFADFNPIFETHGFKRISLFYEAKIDPCGAMYVFRKG